MVGKQKSFYDTVIPKCIPMQFVTLIPDPEPDPEHVNPGQTVIVRCGSIGKGVMAKCHI